MSKRRDEFLGQLERRMEENKRLSEKGGMPEWTAPAVSLVGLHVWQALAIGAMAVTLLGFWIDAGLMERMVYQILLIR